MKWSTTFDHNKIEKQKSTKNGIERKVLRKLPVEKSKGLTDRQTDLTAA